MKGASAIGILSRPITQAPTNIKFNFSLAISLFELFGRTYLIVEEGIGEFLEFFGEHNETLEAFLKIAKRFLHNHEHAIVSNEFLHEDGVHRFVVAGRIQFRNRFDVEYVWRALLDIQRDIFDDLLAGFAIA